MEPNLRKGKTQHKTGKLRDRTLGKETDSRPPAAVIFIPRTQGGELEKKD